MRPEFHIFVSSVQKELAEERRAVRDFVQGDPLLRRYFSVFLFEDLPASDRRADEVYLKEVDRSDIYVGLFGHEYGVAGGKAPSPTEKEFDRATAKGKTRLIFVKGSDDKGRDPRMLQLIRRAGDELIRRRFQGVTDLTAAVYASLVDHLEFTGRLRTLPFDASACQRATLQDIDPERVSAFLRTARRERRFALKATTPTEDALAHLRLLDQGRPCHAAMLLFGRDPQRFLPTAEVKCMHFHGTQVAKPIPSYQIYKGDVFQQVDEAVDFVMAKVNRSVGTRALSTQAPVEYEFSKELLTEAVVNAVAHRDYDSNASVQVMLFSDRLEVWNPGELPPSLTFDDLRGPHASIPRNPLLAEPLFLTRYIEKAGTGTLDMIARCSAAGLPEPTFTQRGGQFILTLWRDSLSKALFSVQGISERQRQAVEYAKQRGQITNNEYQVLLGVSKRTAHRDLNELVRRGVLEKVGSTGRGTAYVLPQGVIKGPKGP
ncbi:MAG TPA: ATP-binding protein [Candidatus Anammoximicrobium sp.]|nr:ATP-binding protein [Candidatus Anammoximicrobium sp.]